MLRWEARWGDHGKADLALPAEELVIRLAVYGTHAVILTDKGSILTLDSDEMLTNDLETPWTVTDVALHNGLLLVLTEDGEVYTRPLEGGTFNQVIIRHADLICSHGSREAGQKAKILKLVAERSHIVFLGIDGDAWVFENTTCSSIDLEIQPKILEYLKGRNILQVDAGDGFTVALLEGCSKESHCVYNDSPEDSEAALFLKSCRKCRHSHLDPDQLEALGPLLTATPGKCSPEACLCGNNTSDATEVWSWGKGSLGQLGHGEWLDRVDPTKIYGLTSHGVTKIVCGTTCTAALTKDQQVLVWGSIGDEGPTHYQSPRQLMLPDDAIAKDVALSDQGVFIIALDGNMYHYKNSSVVFGTIISLVKQDCLYNSILGRGNLIILSVMNVNSQLCNFLRTEMSYLYFLKMCEEKIVKPMLKIHRQEYHSNCSCHIENISIRNSICNETSYLSIENVTIKSNLSYNDSNPSTPDIIPIFDKSPNLSYNRKSSNESKSIYLTPPTSIYSIDVDNISLDSSTNQSTSSDSKIYYSPRSSTPIQIKSRSKSWNSTQTANLNMSPILPRSLKRLNSTTSLSRTIQPSKSDKKDLHCMKHLAEEALLTALLEIADVVKKGLIGAFEKIDPYLPNLWQLEELKSAYQNYNSKLCDVISLEPIPIEGENLQDIFELARLHLENLVPGMCTKNDNVFLEYIWMKPINRIKEYEILLSSIRKITIEGTATAREEIRLENELWKKFQKEIKLMNVHAQSTHTFWSTHEKLSARLIQPGRYLKMNSEVQPLKLLESSKTANNEFYLMTDIFVHKQKAFYKIYDLRTTWVEMETVKKGKVLTLILPEEKIRFVCTASNENLWFKALQDTINACSQQLDEPDDFSVRKVSKSGNIDKRIAQHIFSKYEKFKDAIYEGLWYHGCPHGEGEMRWSSGQRYMGYFKHGDYHGPGSMQFTTPTGMVNMEGIWTNGKAHGCCTIRYPSGYVYSGSVIDGIKNGHGCLQSKNSVYIGNWLDDRKQGYGILIDETEKYLGQWCEDIRHGIGILITQNGICCLANFHQGQIKGCGVLVREDDSHYEGDLSQDAAMNGQGVLRFSHGDVMEGSFHGHWSDSVRVNGVLRPAHSSTTPSLHKCVKKYWQKADNKWMSAFDHCRQQLGLTNSRETSLLRVWKCLGAALQAEREAAQYFQRPCDGLDGLEGLPVVPNDPCLTWDNYCTIRQYLHKAFTCPVHPLGRLLCCLEEAFTNSYQGEISHKLLIDSAIEELKSFTQRLYQIVLALFPILPEEGELVDLQVNHTNQSTQIISGYSLVQKWLLTSRIYSLVHHFYLLHNQDRDQQYQTRLSNWNQHADIPLMSFLEVNTNFWAAESSTISDRGSFCESGHSAFHEAIQTLQQLPSHFAPTKKLQSVIASWGFVREVFSSKIKNGSAGADEMFPAFLFVVVRANISHLGAELNLIEDLLDPLLCNGSLGYMLVSLKACYEQIITEKREPTRRKVNMLI